MTQCTTELTLGTVIQDLRIERGLRRPELAEAIRCHHKHLEHIERGTRNPSPVLLSRIAKVLGTSVTDLKAAA